MSRSKLTHLANRIRRYQVVQYMFSAQLQLRKLRFKFPKNATDSKFKNPQLDQVQIGSIFRELLCADHIFAMFLSVFLSCSDPRRPYSFGREAAGFGRPAVGDQTTAPLRWVPIYKGGKRVNVNQQFLESLISGSLGYLSWGAGLQAESLPLNSGRVGG